MRALTVLLSCSLLAVTIAGCAAPPPPDPSPTATAVPSPSPTPTASPVTLQSTEVVTAALTDAQAAPVSSFVSTVSPSSPAFFRDERADAAGTWNTRVACTAETGADVAVTITSADGTTVEFVAACGQPQVIVMAAGATFTTTGTYQIDVTSVEEAVAAIGLFAAS